MDFGDAHLLGELVLCKNSMSFKSGERRRHYPLHDAMPKGIAPAPREDQAVKLPPRSPNLNAHAERFVRTIKESCLERMILFGEGSLRKAVHEFVVHYHRERNHQRLGNRLIIVEEPQASSMEAIQCRHGWVEC